jgi:hypothetical protein
MKFSFQRYLSSPRLSFKVMCFSSSLNFFFRSKFINISSLELMKKDRHGQTAARQTFFAAPEANS